MIAYKLKSKNLESNNSNINLQNLSLDSRILPLFRNSLLRKINEEIQVDINKYNLNIKNIQSNLNQNFTNQILKIFLKGVTLYNLKLRNFLLQNNKLNLILNIKNDRIYELNSRISNFLNQVNKLIFELNVKSITPQNNNRKTLFNKSDTLFTIPVTKDLLNNCTQYSRIKENGFRKLLIIHKIPKEKLSMGIENNKELIEFGKEIINDLDYKISQNINLINKIKKNKKVLDLVRYTSLFSLDSIKLNYIQFNSNLVLNEQLNTTNISISGSRTEELSYKNLLLNKIFNSIKNSNEIKIEHTINSIIKNKEFDYKID